MCSGLSRRGLHGMGLTELLAEAGAPKGVLYHHFPGGKHELAVQAIATTVDGICAGMDKALASGLSPWDALQAWMLRAEQSLAGSGFECGCPLGTVALESGADDLQIRAALAEGFARIRARVADAFEARGVPQARAASLAALLIAAYEGGLMQARVAGNVEPLRQVREALAPILRDAEQAP
jgi:TetR/AcrR family transcriptional repressor of lmrAB and yxaGH operons